ncbi:MAG: SDR family NAD(P)-dependent oxidoreductase [Christensenellaceae bacterium]|nr:SDR family NAD(P)-dependent oxidoreductase [Christensenellaceae bacterium]
MSRIVLVTGGTKGIGLAISRAFLALGDTVIAASRHPGQPGFPAIAADLCDPAAVTALAENVAAEYGRIDILINCAGAGLGGALEDFSAGQLTTECTLNLIGTARMTAAVLPIMRRQKSGRILSVGSVAGRVGIPFQSLYSASKAGIGAMNDALRLELKGTGVQVCTLEPGDTKSGFTSARAFADGIADNPDYKDACQRALNAMMHDELNGKAPESVAKAAVKLAKKRRMPARKVIGPDYKLLCLLIRLLPRRLVEFVLTKMYLTSKKDAGFRYPTKEE